MFERFVEFVTHRLLQSASPLPAGLVEEAMANGQSRAWLLEPDQRVAVFRWSVPSHFDPALSAGRCEAYFLPTAVAGMSRLGFFSAIAPLAAEALATGSGLSAQQGLDEFVFLEWCDAQGVGLQSAGGYPGLGAIAAVAAGTGYGSAPSEAVEDAQGQAITQQLLQRQAYAEHLSTENDRLRQRLHEFSQRLGEPDEPGREAGAQGEAAAAWPDSFDELAAWCEQRSDKLVVLPRALNEAKGSDYQYPQRVYAGLDFLAGAYRLARTGGLSLEELETALVRTGLQMAGSVGNATAGTVSGYDVTWQGRRRRLDMHLARGGGRETRYCLRIYYFWDTASELAVVGWMPSHLPNSLS